MDRRTDKTVCWGASSFVFIIKHQYGDQIEGDVMGRPVLYIRETRNAYKVSVRRTNLVVDGRITLKTSHKVKSCTSWTELKFCSLNISNMYTSISTDNIPPIAIDVLNNNNTVTSKTQEKIQLCNMILKQNYFYRNWCYFMPNDELTMGDPTPYIFRILSPIHSFIQFIFHTQVKYQGCGNCQSSCINIC